MKPKTHVLLILDKSGSMSSCREATITAFNEKVQQFKLNSTEQEILVSLYSFNGNVYEHCVNVPAQEMAELTMEDYVPGGSTAMFKAVGYAVSQLVESTKDENGDVAYLVEIVSDGQNTDHDPKYTPEAVAEIVSGCQAKGNWTFGYIGANQDLSKVAQRLAIPMANVAKLAMTDDVFAASSYGQALGGTENFLRARKSSLSDGGVQIRGAVRSANLYNSVNAVADFSNAGSSGTLTSTSPLDPGISWKISATGSADKGSVQDAKDKTRRRLMAKKVY